MITFLEFLIERLIGPPVYRGPDSSTWHCPFHGPDDDPSFGTRPHRPDQKDRYRCWSCGAWGDEADFLKEFYPEDDYSQRLERLKKYREEYEDLESALSRPNLISRGLGSTAGVTILWTLLRLGRVDHDDLLEVAAELNHRRQFAIEREIAKEWRKKKLRSSTKKTKRRLKQ